MPRPPHARRFRTGPRAVAGPVAALLGALVLVALLALAPTAQAQTLPIPGLPGGAGGVATQDAAPAAPPDGEAPAAAADPTQALIDILRDDAAREALIRELEAASAGSAAGAAGAGAVPADPSAEAIDAPVETFGERAIEATRSLVSGLAQEAQNFWFRAERIPTTIALSFRALENGVVVEALHEILWLAVALYAALVLLRLLVLPLRNRIGRAGQDASWSKTLILRLTASALHLITIPVAIFLGLLTLLFLGLATAEEGQDVILSDSQVLFINAFGAVETARVVLRLFLSPRSADMRLLPLPDRAARSLWIVGSLLSLVLGYGQLVLVPVIVSGVSLFVGRASAAMLSAVIVAALIGYVLVHRRPVADWLSRPDTESAIAIALRPFALRWHWPIVGYLLYVFVTVLTRPGNVLLPLLQTTGEVAAIVVIGTIVLSGLTERAGKRIQLPSFVGERLPLLEERVNQIRPAYLTILRFFVLLIMLLLLLTSLGLQNVGGFVSSAVLLQYSNGLFSVLLIVGLLSLVWLGMTSWVDYRLNPFVGTVPTARETTLLTLMKNAVTVALIIIGAITSLAQLGMNVGPLIASAGVIGLAISFGAQKMVEDIFSGIFIQAENAMNVGDVVDAGGTVGTVEKLTVRSVTLRDLSGVVHVIPFSSAAKISNYMRDYAYHVADIGVAYREDIEEVRAAMHDAFDILRKDEELGEMIVDDLEWFGVNAFGPSEVVMRARIKTVPGYQWGVGRAYNGIVKRIFDERGIEIPFPHQTLYFGEDKSGRAPPLNLHVQRPERPARSDRPEPRSAAAAPQDPEAEPREPPEIREEREHQDSIRGADHPDEDGT